MNPKCLIVCYSYTGNTGRIAAALQQYTGGDRADIWPRQPYPMSFEPLLAQAHREVAAHYYPPLLPISVDPTAYDVIFVGSPNWCGTIAPPLASFLVKYQMTDKLLAPFYSHCGGTAGDVKRDIETLCPTAQVKPPLAITGDGGARLDQLLPAWLRALGLPVRAARYSLPA